METGAAADRERFDYCGAIYIGATAGGEVCLRGVYGSVEGRGASEVYGGVAGKADVTKVFRGRRAVDNTLATEACVSGDINGQAATRQNLNVSIARN